MPDASTILEGLAHIANHYQWLAIAWHILLTSLFVVLVVGWRPSPKIIIALLCTPAISVSILAFVNGNPFNGILFLSLSLLMVIFGLLNKSRKIGLSSPFFLLSGVLVLLYGLIYPHFIAHPDTFVYLYAAPSGLIPCPTLSCIIGFIMILNGLHSRPVVIAVLVTGLFYALFGIFRLGVWLDIGLLVAALLLGFQWISGQFQFQKTR